MRVPAAMYALVRPLLFRLEPEQAHALTLFALRLAGRLAPLRFFLQTLYHVPPQPVTAFGLSFRNPVGLAAGYDKDGVAWRGLAALGFGHIEIGTVTPRPQPGNPKPRLFRLPEDRALINRMGFPGKGADFVVKNLPAFPRSNLILGVNMGKNQDTPLEEAAGDYLSLYERFAPCADYLAVNVSSPNTVGLRRLQARDALEDLLGQLAARRQSGKTTERHKDRSPPILVKLAPDLSDQELDDALEAILRNGMDGVIATNTTLRREGLCSPYRREAGGLSGAPLAAASTALIAAIQRRSEGRLPIVGVGGILCPADAQAKFDAGATLVQVYTGLVYAGPGLVKRILEAVRGPGSA